jgi:hypothetical protein
MEVFMQWHVVTQNLDFEIEILRSCNGLNSAIEYAVQIAETYGLDRKSFTDLIADDGTFLRTSCKLPTGVLLVERLRVP